MLDPDLHWDWQTLGMNFTIASSALHILRASEKKVFEDQELNTSKLRVCLAAVSLPPLYMAEMRITYSICPKALEMY